MPIDNNTVIGTEEWPLLGYNIFMRQTSSAYHQLEVLRLAALSLDDRCTVAVLDRTICEGVSARVRRYAGSMFLKVNNHALFGVSLSFGLDGLHSLHHVPGNNFEICHPRSLSIAPRLLPSFSVAPSNPQLLVKFPSSQHLPCAFASTSTTSPHRRPFTQDWCNIVASPISLRSTSTRPLTTQA
jgi:hypothetical protein